MGLAYNSGEKKHRRNRRARGYAKALHYFYISVSSAREPDGSELSRDILMYDNPSITLDRLR